MERLLFLLAEDPSVSEQAAAPLPGAVAKWLDGSELLYTHLLPALLRRAGSGRSGATGALLPEARCPPPCLVYPQKQWYDQKKADKVTKQGKSRSHM